MSVDDDAIRIIAKFEGEEEGKRLAAAVALAQQKFEALYSSLGKGDSQTKAAAASLAGLQSQLKSAGGGAQQAGQLMMQAGYAADDLQYGFKGIANNIQPILSQIPALGALAGPISIAAIAAYQLYEHWDLVMGAMGKGIPQPALTGPELLAENLKKATEAMEELAQKTRLEWYELDKLNKLRAEVKDLKATSEADRRVASAVAAPSKADQEAGQGFGRAIAESGGSRAFDEFKGTLEDKKDSKGLVYNEAKGNMSSAADAARDMFDAALAGDKVSRDAIANALAANSTFKGNIAKHSPEAAAKEKEDKEQAKFDKFAREDAHKKYLDHEKDEKKEDDEADKAEEQARKFAEEHDNKLAKWKEDAPKRVEQARKDAVDKAEKRTAGTGLDARADDAMVRAALANGGDLQAAQRQLRGQISRELQSKGMFRDEADMAAASMAKDHAAKLGDDLVGRAMNPRKEAPEHIGAADFARSVESKGAVDMARGIEAMKDQLVELNRQVGRGARLVR